MSLLSSCSCSSASSSSRSLRRSPSLSALAHGAVSFQRAARQRYGAAVGSVCPQGVAHGDPTPGAAPCKHRELQGSTHRGPCSVPCPAPRFSCPLSLPKLAPGSSKPHPGALPGCQPLLTLSWTWLQLGSLQPEGRKRRGSEEQPGRGAQPGDTEGSHVARGQLPRDARPGKAWPGHTCS